MLKPFPSVYRFPCVSSFRDPHYQCQLPAAQTCLPLHIQKDRLIFNKGKIPSMSGCINKNIKYRNNTKDRENAFQTKGASLSEQESWGSRHSVPGHLLRGCVVQGRWADQWGRRLAVHPPSRTGMNLQTLANYGGSKKSSSRRYGFKCRDVSEPRLPKVIASVPK